MSEETRETKFQWLNTIELAVFLFAILATAIRLHIHMDSKVEDNRKETQAILEGIRQDMRDFHVRICVIEERNRK